jgi:hypothetical protein
LRLERALLQLLATHVLLQACDLLAGAQDDEGVASPEAAFGGRGGVEGAFLVAGGEDHGPGPLPDPELADGAVGYERVLWYVELLEPKLDPLLAARDDMSRKSTIRGWVASEASLRPPTA